MAHKVICLAATFAFANAGIIGNPAATSAYSAAPVFSAYSTPVAAYSAPAASYSLETTSTYTNHAPQLAYSAYVESAPVSYSAASPVTYSAASPVAYSAPISYQAPLSYSAPYGYSAPAHVSGPVVSAYSAPAVAYNSAVTAW